MVTDADRAAVATFPQLQRLIDLRDGGWTFRLVSQDGAAQVKGLGLWRIAGMVWAEMIQVRYVSDAVAVRLNPNREMVWQYTGGLMDTVDALLALPPPGDPHAPRLVLRPTPMPWTP